MKRRNTQSKTEILKVLESAGTALSHDMLQAQLSSNVDRATIYRVLNGFCNDGLVHRIVADDGKQYFAFCINCNNHENEHRHSHFHFRCLQCGKVECLENEVQASLPSGYASKTYNLLISGYCNNCPEASSSTE